MKKRLVVLAIAAIMAVGVSGQPNKAADANQQHAKQSQPTVLPADSQNKQASGEAEQPKTDADAPKWYAALERPDWWVVGLAFFTVCVVCWQSWETRKAAKGALLNAQFLINAERPWLVAYFTKSQEETIPEKGNLRFCWEVKNVGRTPAKLTYAAARVVFNLDIDPLPDVPDYGEPDYYFTDRILVPDGTLTFLSHWYERQDGRYRQLYQTENVKALDLLVGFGCVKYRDTFDSGKEYVTCFSDSSMIGGRSILEPFSPWMEAPGEYTKCT